MKTTPVTPTDGLQTNIDEALKHALEKEAKCAVSENSYGVGGLLIDARNGGLIKSMHNTVIAAGEGEKSRLKDPTAHGERQLVDWYFEQRVRYGLPEPKDIIVVTTLDPCCMCTGSILSAGFKAVIGALDDKAGINWDYKHDFAPFVGRERVQIRSSFIYPEVVSADGKIARTAYGVMPSVFTANKRFNEKTVTDCLNTFNEGADKARGIIGKVFERSELKDIKTLNDKHPIVLALKSEYAKALTYRAKDKQHPDQGLAPFLIEAALEDKQKGGDGDAVAFLDYFGNLLMCKPGNKRLSPIRTAYMETIRAYQRVRYALTAKDNEALRYLSEPKYGTFVFVKGFDKGTQSFADMGAYGSTILGEFDNPLNLQYILPRIPQSELDAFIGGMPPRYNKLLTPKRVTNKALIQEIERSIR